MDYTGHAFGPMPELMAISEYITKLHAICEECGELAQFSFRKSSNKSQILLGEKEMYAPLCRECFHKNQLNQ
jgi:thymidine kinase